MLKIENNELKNKKITYSYNHATLLFNPQFSHYSTT